MTDQMLVHDHPEFEALLSIVSERLGLAEALVEKDYWVTHTLWALEEAGLQIHFKGGTSLSKGFGLIERFSEDLDVKIEAPELPRVRSWRSEGLQGIQEREDFFRALEAVSRRYPRDPFQPGSFVRHYEDAGRILASDSVAPKEALRRLLDDMREAGDIRTWPTTDDPSLNPQADRERWAELEAAWRAIGPLFWGARTSLSDCTREIQQLLRALA